MSKNINREKRIKDKIKYITEYVEMLHSKQKVLDNFMDGKGHIIIDLHNVDKLSIHCVTRMELVPDRNGNPIMILVDNTFLGLRFYEFPLTQGFEVHTCNEFLRSLDLGIDICFETYCQYGQLIWKCFDLLTEKQEATA